MASLSLIFLIISPIKPLTGLASPDPKMASTITSSKEISSRPLSFVMSLTLISLRVFKRW